MTDIKTIPGIDNAKLTKLARSLILNADDPDNTKMLKALTVVVDGTPPEAITLSFDEVEGLINIMDLYRPIKARLDITQWVMMTYQLNDLIDLLETGYLITEYILELDAQTKVVTFEGIITEAKCIPEHPEYNPSVVSSPKLFSFTLGDFDIIQQIAVTRLMAQKDPKFEPVAGTFDISWTYVFKDSTVTFETKGLGE